MSTVRSEARRPGASPSNPGSVAIGIADRLSPGSHDLQDRRHPRLIDFRSDRHKHRKVRLQRFRAFLGHPVRDQPALLDVEVRGVGDRRNAERHGEAGSDLGVELVGRRFAGIQQIP